jgi:hypothetical protein
VSLRMPVLIAALLRVLIAPSHALVAKMGLFISLRQSTLGDLLRILRAMIIVPFISELQL